MNRTLLTSLVLFGFGPVLAGCGQGEPPTAPVPAVAAAQMTSFRLTGDLELSAIGQTSQMALIATFSDNTTKDVVGTNIGSIHCISRDPDVVTINSNALITVVGFGATDIACESGNPQRWSVRTATATPLGTHVVAAVVSEPIESDFLQISGGLEGVRVVDSNGRSVTTNARGKFSLAGLPGLPARLTLQKEGYEPVAVELGVTYGEIPIQRVTRISMGESVNPAPLVPNDVSFAVGGNLCSPCRLIRVAAAAPGTVRVRVSWEAHTSNLTLFAGGQVVTGGATELNADIPVNAAGEVLMYFGGITAAAVRRTTRFTFETSLR